MSPPTQVHQRTGFEDEYPFESRFATIDGQQYHYIDEGDGPVMLCVHGNPTWSFAWRRVVTEFAPNHRVVAVDHVGCGFSDKPQEYRYTLDQHISNLCQLIEQLDLKDITLVAHDWGRRNRNGSGRPITRSIQTVCIDEYRSVSITTHPAPNRRLSNSVARCDWSSRF